MSFSTLGLSDALVRAVTEQGYTVPTPIQTQAIPAVLAGGDLLAGAQTGTGKTAGFVLPMLQRLSTQSAPATRRARKKPIRALILTPTRELAAQVEESVRVYGKYLRITSMVIFGGVGIGPQIAQLQPRRRHPRRHARPPARPPGPGQRSTSRRSRSSCSTRPTACSTWASSATSSAILALLPKQRQNLLFSATFSDEIKDARRRPARTRRRMIEVAPRNSTVEIIAQTRPPGRPRPQARAARPPDRHATTGTRCWSSRAPSTAPTSSPSSSTHDGITALAIHGNKSQGARTRALAEFKDGSLQVLVATDIAARGIDIDQLPHVVNYDLPNVPEDYVHRIGRTGRAGASGEAISLVCVDEHAFLRDIEKLLKRTHAARRDRRLRARSAARGPQPILQRQGRGGARTPPRGAAGGGGRSARPPASATAHAATHRGGAPATPGRKVVPAGRPAAHAAKAPRPLAKPVARPAPATAPAPRSPLAAQHRPVNRGR